MIFNEVIEHVAELIIDPFGNYLIQKLIDTVSNEKRLRILSRVQYDLVSISKNIHGTRAAQKLIELITSEAEVIIVRNAFLVCFRCESLFVRLFSYDRCTLSTSLKI